MSSFNTNNRRGVTRSYDYANGQKVTVGAASAQSSSISSSNEVMLHATTDCYVRVGSNPTAADSAGSFPMTAGEKFHIRITPGELIAVIQDSDAGALFILPVLD